MTGPSQPAPSSPPATSAGGGGARFPLGALIVVALCLLLPAIFFGPTLLREQRHKRLLRSGAPATARVRDIRPTGNTHNERPEVNLTLDVTPDASDSGGAFSAVVITFISPVFLPRYQPGAIVKVRYNPQNRSEVALVEP